MAKKEISINKQSILEHRQLMLKKFLKNKLAVAGLFIVITMAGLAVLAPVIARYDPLDMQVMNRLVSPSSEHFFGTDNFGRDLWSRTLYGLRSSMLVGAVIASASGVIGMILGLLAGYFPKVDIILMRVIEGIMAIPSMLMAIALMAALGATVNNVIIALTVVYIPSVAKIARGSVLAVKEQTYIEAIRSKGASWMRIIFKHIAPNVLSPVIVQVTYIFASAILTESALSFLGVGIPAPAPSLGNILSDAKTVIFNAVWMTIYPGITMLLLVVGINILGDGIRDVLDPLSN